MAGAQASASKRLCGALRIEIRLSECESPGEIESKSGNGWGAVKCARDDAVTLVIAIDMDNADGGSINPDVATG
jgi:hypothetical protein